MMMGRSGILIFDFWIGWDYTLVKLYSNDTWTIVSLGGKGVGVVSLLMAGAAHSEMEDRIG